MDGPRECHTEWRKSDREGEVSYVWCLVAQSCPTLGDPTDCSPPGSSVHGDSPGKNTGVDCYALPQRNFPTQGLNSGLPHCRQIIYQVSHQGSPRILEWVAYPFPRGSSQPRNWTKVSCITGRFFTNWTIREALSPYIVAYLWIETPDKKISHLWNITWDFGQQMLMVHGWIIGSKYWTLEYKNLKGEKSKTHPEITPQVVQDGEYS